MTDQNGTMEQNGKQEELRQLIGQAVADALATQLPQLQARIAQQIFQALPAAMPMGGTPGSGAESASLARAVAAIQAGSTQKEILRALLDSGSAYGSRVGLFVVKAGIASGWQSRGFGNGEETVKDFPLDLNAGPAAHAYQNRVAAPGNVAEMGRDFVAQFGGPSDEQVLVLPLVLKDKVAALVYADCGNAGRLDTPALQLLVMATSAWLEVASLRKQASKEEGPAAPAFAERPAPAVQTVSSFSDPFAAHAPRHIPAAAPVPAPAVEVIAMVAAQASAAAAPAMATDPLAGLSPGDADTHRKAQRFARLLVDEIKLYNQAKVAEGRRNKDLYDRLKEDIDKSQATFQKRYGGTVAASVDYFQQEIMRSLAEDDISVMGQNFRR
jgi:hypothetical protein